MDIRNEKAVCLGAYHRDCLALPFTVPAHSPSRVAHRRIQGLSPSAAPGSRQDLPLTCADSCTGSTTSCVRGSRGATCHFASDAGTASFVAIGAGVKPGFGRTCWPSVPPSGRVCAGCIWTPRTYAPEIATDTHVASRVVLGYNQGRDALPGNGLVAQCLLHAQGQTCQVAGRQSAATQCGP